jgi:hypothetical protein
MAKTKISEFSATPASNTDIDSIFIGEGMAPSNVNDAIRELMAQLKDWQSGTSNDPYVVGSSGSLTLNQGTANGVAYLNGSKVVTSGSALVFDGSNLGLGVTPSAWGAPLGGALQVGNASLARNSGGATLYLNSNAYYDGSNWRYINTGFSAKYTVNNNSGQHFWETAPSGTAGNAITFTQAMTLDASGRLGVGRTSVGAQLDVLGAASTSAMRIVGNSGASIYVDLSGGGDNYYDATNNIFRNASGTERARIDSSGNFCVGSTDSGITGTNTGAWIRGQLGLIQASRSGNPALNLCRTTSDGDVASFDRGTVARVGWISVTTTSTTYNSTSDYRLKENVQPMTGALSKVAQLKPVTYKWKSNGQDGQGFIAHELKAVVPDCVTGEKDAVDSEGNPVYQGIDTSMLVATLTAALQEAVAKINSLEARLDAANL